MARAWSASAIRSWKSSGVRPAANAALPGLYTADKLNAFVTQLGTQLFEGVETDLRTAIINQVDIQKQRVLSEQTGRSGGIAPLLRLVVDNKADPTLASVEANSRVVLAWSYMPEVAIKTYDALVARSPKQSGKYIEGLLRFVDAEPVEDFRTAITFDTTEVRIVASVDYARKLEIGKDKRGQPWVKQVAPHIVEETTYVARSIFGELALFAYQYVELTGAFQLSRKGQFPRHFENGAWRQGRTPRTRHGQLETEVRYPAILITPTD